MGLRSKHATASPFMRFAGASKCISAFCVLFVILLCELKVEAVPTAGIETRLQLVQVVFRSGNRTPESPYDNDPNANFDYGPFGWNELDRYGRESSYALGRYLRNRYGSFIRDFNREEVSIISSGVRRAKLSTQLVSAGLFPPSNDWKWSPPGELGEYWQPIIFNYKPTVEDDIIYMKHIPCPVYEEELRRIDNGPVMKEALKRDPETFLVFGANAKVRPSVHHLAQVWQTMDIENSYNLTIPDWAKHYYPDRLLPYVKFHFRMNAWTRTMQRLRGGPLLGALLKNMDAKSKGSQEKMALYGGHDDTVANLGLAMRVWDDFIPVFSSAIIVELHSDSAGTHYVKTFFHNDTSKSPIQLTVPGCLPLCPLSAFRSILSDSIPTNYAAECKSRRNAAVAPHLHLWLFVFLVPFYIFKLFK